MDEVTERRVVEKASYVRDAVEVPASKQDTLSFEENRNQREERDIVEREFQTAIEACIDIGEMVLNSRNESVPDTNAAVFRTLGEKGLLDDQTAERIARAAGLRNVLSHQYGADINDRGVFNSLQNELDAFHGYLSQIRDHVE